MRAVVIGGTGHVGTYLIPRLVQSGYDVISISRGERDPYLSHSAWDRVEEVYIDREEAEEEGNFGERILNLDPDVIMDLICFTPESARHLVDSLRGEIQHLIHCGSAWVHGPSREVPTTEDEPRNPIGDYGKKKVKIEKYLHEEARKNGFPATILHPGHIVGKGWVPLNPAGNFNPEIYEKLARGEKVKLPNLGMETVHHVHADDVAQAFICAMNSWSVSVGESFHVTSPSALTLRGYAKSMAEWFGQEPNLEFLPWEKWKETVSEEDAEMTWDHIAHSPNISIKKTRSLLGYNPRYTSLQAVQESVEWLIQNDGLET